VSCSIAASVAGQLDTTAIWREAFGPREGWDSASAAAAALCKSIARRAAETLACDHADTVIASATGTAFTTEAMQHRLDNEGPVWLEPEQMLYQPSHVLAALAHLEGGVRGSAMTFLGPDAAGTAVRYAVRRLASGRAPAVLCGAYEIATPRTAQRLSSLELDPEHAHFCFHVLRADGRTDHTSALLESARSTQGGAGGPAVASMRALARELVA
jgi:hypothetical protein